ncbi:UDP-N-acetylmuramate dehydrogenase [Janthinobacterium aquaticum]|uniref:UDP-N-acetylmuramate dehydrogenase n=1 Tax=Janthinobacterium sp. FT58W TaxID=2654254 RepID=UPI001264457C|nr:UDP-N-acetylmuramate dehydrogenase [Janthinobacterium sp. FT58W]KAB8037329.1 UDP-N-acetylmuramate dehydrogenase [Janthinobacterium sp. FT58W]
MVFCRFRSIIEQNISDFLSDELTIEHNYSLRHLNTFGIDARAAAYLRISSTAQLLSALQDPDLAAMPRLVLGGGSNIVLTGDFSGVVLHMATRGMRLAQASLDTVLVTAAAGENWHDFVQWTLAQGVGGLENLSLIPGTVGAAPIQNIGAYGVEIKDYLHSVSVMHAGSGMTFEMNVDDCRFGYRDSIFKQAQGRELIVLEVTFALPAEWRPNLRYAELAQAVAEQQLEADQKQPTMQQVADTVMAIRRRKLPDPAVIGNAGSFFKNPVVSQAQCEALLQQFPALVHHAQADGTHKLAAGWLIDQCGWKGRNLGPAGVYPKQALVLVNNGGARGADITRLAEAITADVEAKYGVKLSPEPVFV